MQNTESIETLREREREREVQFNKIDKGGNTFIGVIVKRQIIIDKL